MRYALLINKRNMNKKLITLLLMFSTLWLYAQSSDKRDDEDWRFAAGVTLYSNMTYPLEISDYFHPFEFDFKYKMSDKSILRANVPIIWKRKILGTTQAPHLPDETTTLEQYVADLHSIDNSGFYDPVNVIENYTTVLGASLGYEYYVPILKKINLLGGIDIGYTYQYMHSRSFVLGYYPLDANNETTLYQIDEITYNSYDNIFNVRPFVGLSYQFQKLMIEGSIGYYYSIYSVKSIYKNRIYDTVDINNASPYIANWTRNLDKLTYKISLFYTL